MTEPKKLSPEETMRAIDEQAARDAIEDVLGMDDAALDEELAKHGENPALAVTNARAAYEAALASAPVAIATPVDSGPSLPKTPETPEEEVSGPREKALSHDNVVVTDREAPPHSDNVVPLREPPPAPAGKPWTLYALLAAAAVVLLLAGLLKRQEVIAFFRGHDYELGPAPDWVQPSATSSVPTPNELALTLRIEGLTACSYELWGVCKDKLDQAAGIDPSIEARPDVIDARAAIASNLLDGGKKPPKPPQ